MNYQERLLKAIPGGAHTYSRGYDQFPNNAPEILSSGKGAYVYDEHGQEFLDYGMALRSICLGYANDKVDEAAIKQIRMGNNLTRPSFIELEAAEKMIELIDSVDMVKFTKNGSSAVSAAVKLARAYTGRELVARCSDHPFFSYDDWFIGSTVINRGIPNETIHKTKKFEYGNISSLINLIEQHPDEIACVVLEPATTGCPKNGFSLTECCNQAICKYSKELQNDNYLKQVEQVCRKNGIVFILDEMITGFRWHMKGAQFLYGVNPDLCTFGKSMANGYSVACVGGRRDIMKLGSIEEEGTERVFLLSTTHGAEMSSLGAFVETVDFLQDNKVIDHLWSYGSKLIEIFNALSKRYALSKNIYAGGIACSPWYKTLGDDGKDSLALRTLFNQEMIKNGVLMPWIALSWSHGDKELEKTKIALEKTFGVCSKALAEGNPNFLLEGPCVKPVFRKFN